MQKKKYLFFLEPVQDLMPDRNAKIPSVSRAWRGGVPGHDDPPEAVCSGNFRIPAGKPRIFYILGG